MNDSEKLEEIFSIYAHSEGEGEITLGARMLNRQIAMSKSERLQEESSKYSDDKLEPLLIRMHRRRCERWMGLALPAKDREKLQEKFSTYSDGELLGLLVRRMDLNRKLVRAPFALLLLASAVSFALACATAWESAWSGVGSFGEAVGVVMTPMMPALGIVVYACVFAAVDAGLTGSSPFVLPIPYIRDVEKEFERRTSRGCGRGLAGESEGAAGGETAGAGR